MVNTERFYDYLIELGITKFYGVPDSLLKDICACITTKSKKEDHIITANEGNAVAIAAGQYLATGKPALVYMQNSGLGNTVNPLLSLADEAVYKIPMLLMIGWRGEPGVHDEPQHVKQGILTLPLLETMAIKYLVLSDDFEADLTTLVKWMKEESKPVALVVRKDTFSKYKLGAKIENPYTLKREEALEVILNKISQEALIVSTTGKTSREIFELRNKLGHGHQNDFLTVGSMGHTSSIALGLSLNTDRNVYCIDGDGSMIMHLGGMGIAIHNAKDNFKYILINNGSHESVGGQPTIGFDIDVTATLIGLGFNNVFNARTKEEIEEGLALLNKEEKVALVIYTAQGSRDDLGRPTTSPEQNKIDLMRFIKSE